LTDLESAEDISKKTNMSMQCVYLGKESIDNLHEAGGAKPRGDTSWIGQTVQSG
jgi:hypothetical protein